MTQVQKFEDLMKLAGNFGRWQICLSIWISLYGIIGGMHSYGSIYLGATPDHWCAPPESQANTSADLWKERYIPKIKADEGNATTYDKCHIIDYDENSNMTRCSRRQFNHTIYKSTLVTEWDLVCDRLWMYSTITAVWYVGMLLGSIVFGYLGDRFGRRRTSLICVCLLLFCCLMQAVSPNYEFFVIFRMLTGAASIGGYIATFVLLMEVISNKSRAMVSQILFIPFALGSMLLPLLAYFIRIWWQLQLAMTVPALLLLVFFKVLPESPQWLITKKYNEEAYDILSEIAKTNKKQLPNKEQTMEMITEIQRSEEEMKKKEKQNENKCLQGPIQLFLTPKIRKITLISMYCWFVCTLTYYGISFDAAQLSSDIYLSLFLSGLVEIPAYIVAVPLVRYWGRKPTLVLSYFIGGISVLCVTAVPAKLNWPKLLLGLIGKWAASLAFGVIYLHSSEVFPTPLRNIGMGSCSTTARIASIASPFIVNLGGAVHWSIPSIVFGVSTLLAGLLSIMLPETLGRVMPQTVEEVELQNADEVTKVTPLGDKGQTIERF